MSTCLQSGENFFSFLDQKEPKNTCINNLRRNDNDVWNLFKSCQEEINSTTNSSDTETETDNESDNESSKKKLKNDRDEYEDKCEYCHTENCLINNNEAVYCRNCGAENRTIIDTNPEWRFYGSEDNKRNSDPNRCGGPLNPYFPNGTLSIVILGFGSEQFRKVNKYNGLTYKERALITLLNSITNKATLENLPQSIIDQTIFLYQNICLPHVKRGTSIQSLVANCFAYSLKEKGFIRTNQEIANLFNLSVKKFSKGNTEFNEYMLAYNKNNNKNTSNMTPKEFLAQYCKLLDLNPQQSRSCLYALYVVDRLGLCPENNPKSITTGILYMVCEHYGLPYTKKDIADYCKTSEVTVGNTYSQMIRYKSHLIPPKKD